MALLSRVIPAGIPVDPSGVVTAEVRGIQGALGGIAPPPRQLGGWESLCATEYAATVARLEQALGEARAALAEAVRMLGAA